GSEILGIVKGVGDGIEEATLLSGKQTRGMGLAQALESLVKKVEMESLLPGWIVTDQNGEVYRAYELGCMLTRVLRKLPLLQECPLTYPAMSFGDTGAASGFLAACMVIHAFQHQYNSVDSAVILSSSDRNERSSVLIMRH